MEDIQQKLVVIEKEIKEIKEELKKKQDKASVLRRVIGWLVAALLIIAVYGSYYLYITSLFR